MFEKSYDIVVAGGGIAGVAAAVASARRGCRTALVEKTVATGGLATNGLVNFYQALCDGNGGQVTFGLAEELLHRSIRYGFGDIPPGWKNERNAPEERRFTTLFSPASFVLALDEILEESGVEVWFDTLICDVEQKDGLLCGIVVENESGRGVIRASRFIDATGSALLFRRCGAGCFTADNHPSLWEFEYNRGKFERFVWFHRETQAGKWRGLSGRQVTEFLLLARDFLRERYRKLYDSGESDRRTHYPVLLPNMAQFRKLYAIRGAHVLDDRDAGESFPDSVGLVADWRKPGAVWEVPYSSLYAADGPANLLAAGRCISAVNNAWEVMRVIQAAALTGEVAGVAVALSAEPRTLPAETLQQELRRLGFVLHRPPEDGRR